MSGGVTAFIPAAVAMRQRATVRKFRSASADAAARARTLDELGVREGHLFGRLLEAGVVIPVDNGRYFLSEDGLARWKRNARLGVLIAVAVVVAGALIAYGLAGR